MPEAIQFLLDKMESQLDSVLASANAELEIREYGNVLALDLMEMGPIIKRSEVVSRLQGFSVRLSSDGGDARTKRFLNELIQKIGLEEK